MKLSSAFAITLTVFIATLGMAQDSSKTLNKPVDSPPAISKSSNQVASEPFDDLSKKIGKIEHEVIAFKDTVDSESRKMQSDTQSKFSEIKKSLDEVKIAHSKINEVKASQDDIAKRINQLASDFEALKRGLSSPAKKSEPASDSLTPWIAGLFFTVIIIIYTYHRTQMPRNQDVNQVFDPRTLNAEVAKVLNEKLSPLVRNTDLVRTISELKVILSSMQQTLPQAAGKVAADEVSKSQVGDLKSKIAQLQAELDTANSKASLDRQALDTANAGAIDADRAKKQAISDLRSANATLQESQAREAVLRQDIEGKKRELQLALDEVRSIQVLCQEAKSDLQRTREFNIPAGISEPELVAQMQALHREAIKGNSSSVIAWATLSSFAAADTDPSSKDFLLHVVKRLGLVLVSHWKTQESISPKERHEKLSQWAKCLTAHAQGRFSLIVPPIGAPVNKTTMATADNATIVQEVLCWQVRNPSGATFSLAEIA